MTDDLDGRLRGAFRELAEPMTTNGVYERVAVRHARRRGARRVRAAGAGALATLAVVSVAFLVGRDDSPSTVATDGGASGVRVIQGPALDRDVATSGRAVELRTVTLQPDQGYVRSPLLATGATIALAAYDRVGRSYAFPPSHVIRVRQPGGGVVDRLDLQGEVLALADGEGARWALTRDRVVTGPDDPEFRIKRIGPDGTVVSNAVPPGAVPAGDLVAAGGGVWLPVEDGVLRFDPVTGAFAARVPLDEATERRGIANLGKFVGVTDGTAVRRLDPSTDAAAEAPEVMVPIAFLERLVGLAADDGVTLLLGERRSDQGPILYETADGEDFSAAPLPEDLEEPSLRTANGVTWVEGVRDGSAVAIVLRDGRAQVQETIALPHGRDVAFTFLDREQAVIVAGGRMHVARLD
jgi:hypothetical protein